uniref:ATP synthase subunit a n=1 Tax=Romanomermis iyengari TaxID=416168 RepID=A1Z3B8_ROMIY|nr:ATP synthase F0 subunit 6 [Romanomermis iyengari]ABL73801.1 ATP synthase F0 subunit 6 [Romanomermis iyengari]
MLYSLFKNNQFLPFQFMNLKASFMFLLLFMLLIIKMNFTMKNFFKIQFTESIMLLLLLLNFLGLVPYFWSMGSYLWNNLLLSILFWGTNFFSTYFKYINIVLSHLLPHMSPWYLWHFLIFLEMVSHLVRPLTLSLRLMCNLIAGHILISLVSTMGFKFFIMLVIMILFECMISMIQAVVFSLLNLIYFKEFS